METFWGNAKKYVPEGLKAKHSAAFCFFKKISQKNYGRFTILDSGLPRECGAANLNSRGAGQTRWNDVYVLISLSLL
jgi:hypothetical protein